MEIMVEEATDWAVILMAESSVGFMEVVTTDLLCW